MTMLVSVIIPTFNRANDLARALTSVLNQTYSNWEVIIIDNHSFDNTEDVIKNFDEPRFRLLKIHNNGIIAASRNMGVKNTRGKYIAFLDSDDWWAPEKLEKSVYFLEQGHDVVYHDLYMVAKQKQRLHWRKAKSRRLKKPVFNDLIENGNTLYNSSVVVRRNVFAKITGFSEESDLVAAEDYEGWLRLSLVTDKFYRINMVLGYYWVGGGNTNSPERTLTLNDLMVERYPSNAYAIDAQKRDSLNCYIKGRAFYQLESYDYAINFLSKVKLNKKSIYIYAKSIWMLFYLRIMHINIKDR